MYADLPGVRLWFETSPGDGVPVVFVHPATGSSEIWRPQIEAFAGRRPLVVYDKRGTRRSVEHEAALVSSPADDLLALLDHLGLPKVHLVGAGRGGADALTFAVRHPHRLLSLVVTNSYGGVTDASYVARTERLWTPELRALPPELRELSPSYRDTTPEGVAEWLRIHAEAYYRPGASQGREPLRFSDLARLDLPVLLVAGDADLLSPPSLMETLAQAIPRARLEVVARSAHASPWERPAQWNTLVDDFLSVGYHRFSEGE